MDTKFTFPARNGTVQSGLQYYEVESKDEKIEGCYTKIGFYNKNKYMNDKFPIYKQTGDPENCHYLKIVIDENKAPWVFTDKYGNIKYM